MCSLILKMPWPLGSFQLYAQPRFWRVWDPKRNLVSGWDEHNGIPRKRILCPLRRCNWWALLFGSCTIHPPPTFDWSDKSVFGLFESTYRPGSGLSHPPTFGTKYQILSLLLLCLLCWWPNWPLILAVPTGGQVCNFCIYSERQKRILSHNI